jgi:hypothetical protein
LFADFRQSLEKSGVHTLRQVVFGCLACCYWLHNTFEMKEKKKLLVRKIYKRVSSWGNTWKDKVKLK